MQIDKIQNNINYQSFTGLAKFGKGFYLGAEKVIDTQLIKEYMPFVEDYGLKVVFKNGKETYCIDRIPFELYDKTIQTASKKGKAALEYVNKGLAPDAAIELYRKGTIVDLEKGFFSIVSK